MNTTMTWTTKHGYTATCTLANAMHNRRRNEIDTFSRNWSNVAFAMSMEREIAAKHNKPFTYAQQAADIAHMLGR